MSFLVPGRPAFRRVAALVCMGACLLGQTETLPQVLALGAWVEHSHTVQVAQANGQVTVVLSHQRGSPLRPDFTPRHQAGNPRHRHGPAARLFCCFASSPASRADHTASFASGAICESAQGVIKVPATHSDTPVVVLSSAMFSSELGVSKPLPSPTRIRARLRPPASLELLRATVLVI